MFIFYFLFYFYLFLFYWNTTTGNDYNNWDFARIRHNYKHSPDIRSNKRGESTHTNGGTTSTLGGPKKICIYPCMPWHLNLGGDGGGLQPSWQGAIGRNEHLGNGDGYRSPHPHPHFQNLPTSPPFPHLGKMGMGEFWGKGIPIPIFSFFLVYLFSLFH